MIKSNRRSGATRNQEQTEVRSNRMSEAIRATIGQMHQMSRSNRRSGATRNQEQTEVRSNRSSEA